jgi:hypothetical protein
MSSDPADTFRQEARELLEQLEQGLLDLEQNPANAELVDSIFRALHTIKGSGAMFGFTDVAAFVMSSRPPSTASARGCRRLPRRWSPSPSRPRTTSTR